ncbi:MAG: hypothetical protein OQJ98_02290 [Candidatus Pacebacteria bacterium]|nr:hypothetical protein [Candidatus Paceibacterota bacterium]
MDEHILEEACKLIETMGYTPEDAAKKVVDTDLPESAREILMREVVEHPNTQRAHRKLEEAREAYKSLSRRFG